MGFTRHIKSLVDRLYPHAANALGYGAVKGAELLSKLGVSNQTSEFLVDKALRAIPSSQDVSKKLMGVANDALDMYGEYRRDGVAARRYISGAAPFLGMNPASLPPSAPREGYSSLGAPYNHRRTHRKAPAAPKPAAIDPKHYEPDSMIPLEHVLELVRKAEKRKAAPKKKAVAKVPAARMQKLAEKGDQYKKKKKAEEKIDKRLENAIRDLKDDRGKSLKQRRIDDGIKALKKDEKKQAKKAPKRKVMIPAI